MANETQTPVRTGRKVVHGAEAQAKILAAVDALFYRDGARAVSVDAVVELAGVNKMSVYRQFKSKDDLLLHYLELRDARFWTYFEASLAKQPGHPRAQLVQVFRDLAERTCRPGYRGCPFVNIAIEFPERDHPARCRVAQNKAQLLQRLQQLAAEAGAAEPLQLAKGLALLIEGVYAASQTYDADLALPSVLVLAAEGLLAAAGVAAR
jgi:AcrR family transcriptional regulator